MADEGQASLLDEEPRAAWPPPKVAGRKRRVTNKPSAAGEVSEG